MIRLQVKSLEAHRFASKCQIDRLEWRHEPRDWSDIMLLLLLSSKTESIRPLSSIIISLQRCHDWYISSHYIVGLLQKALHATLSLCTLLDRPSTGPEGNQGQMKDNVRSNYVHNLHKMRSILTI